MSKSLKRRVALMCLFCLMITSLCGAAFAAGEEDEEAVTEQVIDYTPIPLYVDGIRVGDGFKVDATTYMPIRAFSEALRQEVTLEWDQETQTVTVVLEPKTDEDGTPLTESLTVTATVGEQYMVANDRYLYVPNGVLNLEGTVMVPIRELAKIFGVEIAWHDDTWSISIDSTELDILDPGADFYVEDDLYWLSHIIHAESGNQPLEGMIGVGNVVLNRVADPTCPDTIYDVIFDNRYGVQFSPTETGAIYDDPNEESIIAAKLCLEGYDVAGASLFFLNPEIGVSNWFASTRTYVATIGDHAFYA